MCLGKLRILKTLAFVSLAILCGHSTANPDRELLQCSADTVGLSARSPPVADREFYAQFIADVQAAKDLMPMRDQSCFIDVAEFAQSNEYLAVDVRQESDFDADSIAGSINIALEHIATRGFLKRRPMVLIDYGYRSSDLHYLCSSLEHEGFEEVRILSGGIAAWQAFNQKRSKYANAEGKTLGASKKSGKKIVSLKKISQLDFILAGHKHQWLVFDFSSSAMPPSSPQIIKISKDALANAQRKKIESEASNFYGQYQKFPNILLLGDSGKEISSLGDRIPDELMPFVYLLEGGKAGYDEYVVNHSLMLLQRRLQQYSLQSGCR